MGYFAIGEAMAVYHSVGSIIVPPGDVTVTTFITTEIREGTILTTTPVSQPPEWIATGLRSSESEQDIVGSNQLSVEMERLDEPESIENEPSSLSNPQPLNNTSGTAIIRTDDDEADITYSGSWSNINSSYAFNGNFERSNTGGDTASFTFNSDWIGVGFVGGTGSGQAEIFIDGVSQGIVDLYSREDQSISRYYSLPISASHTISVSVLGTSHPNSSNTRVNIDFFDYWNGESLADGTFEQNDARVFVSNNWSTINNGTASGGNYGRSNSASAWFPFTGDSVTYQAFAYSNGGWAKSIY